jgi:hypothetical protein
VKDETDATHRTSVVVGDVYKILVGKPEGKMTLGRPRSTWQDIKMDLKKHDVRVWIGFIWLMTGSNDEL